MKQLSMQVNSAQVFIDRETKEEFYFARIIHQDQAGKFVELPSCKVVAEAFGDIQPVAKARIMVTCDAVTKTQDGKYLTLSNAKVAAYTKPSLAPREIDEDALSALLDSDAPF